MLYMSRAGAFEDVEDAADGDLMLMYGWSRGKNPYIVSLPVSLPWSLLLESFYLIEWQG